MGHRTWSSRWLAGALGLVMFCGVLAVRAAPAAATGVNCEVLTSGQPTGVDGNSNQWGASWSQNANLSYRATCTGLSANTAYVDIAVYLPWFTNKPTDYPGGYSGTNGGWAVNSNGTLTTDSTGSITWAGGACGGTYTDGRPCTGPYSSQVGTGASATLPGTDGCGTSIDIATVSYATASGCSATYLTNAGGWQPPVTVDGYASGLYCQQDTEPDGGGGYHTGLALTGSPALPTGASILSSEWYTSWGVDLTPDPTTQGAGPTPLPPLASKPTNGWTATYVRSVQLATNHVGDAPTADLGVVDAGGAFWAGGGAPTLLDQLPQGLGAVATQLFGDGNTTGAPPSGTVFLNGSTAAGAAQTFNVFVQFCTVVIDPSTGGQNGYTLPPTPTNPTGGGPTTGTPGGTCSAGWIGNIPIIGTVIDDVARIVCGLYNLIYKLFVPSPSTVSSVTGLWTGIQTHAPFSFVYDTLAFLPSSASHLTSGVAGGTCSSSGPSGIAGLTSDPGGTVASSACQWSSLSAIQLLRDIILLVFVVSVALAVFRTTMRVLG